MPHEPIAVTRSSMPPIEEYFEEVSGLWDSHWLTNMGEKHAKLEKELRDKLDVPAISLFTNGHAALECALETFSLKGSIITTPFSFASTTHAIVRKGLRPIFADIKPDDLTLNPAKIEGLIEDDTVAILPVHVYGNICDVEAIQEIADSYGLKVIYDAAHAFGEKLHGKSVAAFGDASMFSFHATKAFNTIEGGALTFMDERIKQRADQWKNFGIVSAEDVLYPGGNAKMNEFCAAMGLCNLRHFDEEISKRKVAVERYRERLDSVKGLRVVKPSPGETSNYSYMPVLFDEDAKRDRDAIFRTLEANDIHPRKYFYPLISDYACYESTYDSNLTPIARSVAKRILTLPLYADLPISSVDRICDIIENEM